MMSNAPMKQADAPATEPQQSRLPAPHFDEIAVLIAQPVEPIPSKRDWFAVLEKPRMILGMIIVAALLGSTALALTFLNPHVYLDTVVLLGSVAAREGGRGAPLFGFGAAIASCAWFSGLGFGARYLAPLFARPLAWRLLDGAIGLVMLALAGSLLA